jgi:hypothetical protein
MENKLTEYQYNLLSKYLTEVRGSKDAYKLSALVKKNPSAQFISFIARVGTSDDGYDFQLIKSKSGTGLMIKDLNQGTSSKGCQIDVNLDMILYDNTVTINFGGCGKFTKNKIVGVKVYASEEDLASGRQLDSVKIENTLDHSLDQIIDKYHDALGNSSDDDDIHLDARYNGKITKFDGEITRRSGSVVEMKLLKAGSKTPINVVVDLDQEPFIERNGEVVMRAKASKVETGEVSSEVMELPIKHLEVDYKNVEQKQRDKEEAEVKPKSDEELISIGREAMAEILANKTLKDAFAKHPKFWNLFIAELNGKQAPSKGITHTLDIIGRINKQKLIGKLGGDFITGKSVIFQLYDENVAIEYTDDKGKRNKFEMNKNQTLPYKGMVREFAYGDKGQIIVSENKSYMVVIKEKTEIPNVFNSDIVKLVNTKNGVEEFPQKNIKIKISESSNGYRPNKENTQTTK